MAGIVQPMRDIMQRLEGIGGAFQFVRVWNNQLERMQKSEDYAFPRPAAFLEVINPAAYDLIGAGFSESDVIFSIHVVHELYDSQDGTMDQNLEVFDLRDKVLASLAGFEPTACSKLFFIAEQQDHDHDNLYHYIIDFKCSFIESNTSPYNPGAGRFIDSVPPTTLVVNTTEAVPGDIQDAPFNSINTPYKIPQ